MPKSLSMGHRMPIAHNLIASQMVGFGLAMPFLIAAFSQ